jgi:transketolase
MTRNRLHTRTQRSVERFGASASHARVNEELGITVDAVVRYTKESIQSGC